MLTTFGGLGVAGSGFRRRKPLLVLAFLAIEGRQSRRHLAELFWPGSDKGLRSLATTLTRLRTGLSDAIRSDDDWVWATLECDAERFTEHLRRGETSEAKTLYGGAFLDGVHVTDCGAELEEWIYATRELFAKQLQEALLSAAEASATVGDFALATFHAEAAHGVPGASVLEPEVLERCYTVLKAGNSPRVAEVERDAKDFGVAFTLTASQARARFRPQAERPMAAVSGPVCSNVLERTTPFIGRQAELAVLSRLLSDRETRLVTLIGVGGIGKSRLALHVASTELCKTVFEDGIYAVSLDAVTEPARLPQVVASLLGIAPVEHGDVVAEVIRVLRPSRILLVLDNFEQVVTGAAFVSELLRRCPLLTVLVTSRERLNLEGEQLFRLAGLSWASDSDKHLDAAHQEAVELFVQRAKRVSLDFELSPGVQSDVSAVCALVEGSPLGIELAATWVEAMSVRDIAAELRLSLDVLRTSMRDVPERHASIRATFESSWKLLSTEEQTILRKLAVFIGGFTRHAAAAVADASSTHLVSLIDKSLLRVGDNWRFDRHVMVYEFCQLKLRETPIERAEAEERHATYFLELAEEADAHLHGVDQGKWLEMLDLEHDNLRAALRWTIAHDRVETGIRLAAALGSFWHMRGHLSEGRGWFQRVLSGSCGRGREVGAVAHARAQALRGAGILTWMQGDLAEARDLFEEGLGIMEHVGDELGRAKALNNLGILAYLQRDYSEAQRLLELSFAGFETLGDSAGASRARGNLGLVVFLRGDVNAARGICDEVLAWFRASNDVWGVVTSLNNLARVAERQGEAAYAAAILAEGLTLGDEIGATRVQVDMVQQAAGLLVTRHPTLAAKLMVAAEAFREQIGAPMEPASRPGYVRFQECVKARLGPPELAAARLAAREMGLPAAVELSVRALTDWFRLG